ncbi:hypothetical protein F5Y06DRAFT_276264 [Hypoxylon sp. FL0890]|nr:hypothetical protein F5Y06DRAFT_276264 [Hypoxylon sp. FL0890]
MLLQFLHLAQAALAAYGGKQSYIAITNLRKYDKASEKLAKYSSEAERQRQKTYATQTSGVVALLLSFFMSLLLALRGSVYGFIPRYLAPSVTLVGIGFAREHIRDFWAGKTPGLKGALPKMGDYEEAERRTHELLSVLDMLVFSWVATLFLVLIVGY